jgi:hypothetical protein
MRRSDLRIVLTGAGTSAFVGECLAPALARKSGHAVDAVATTDLVGSPMSWLRPRVPMLLVSFARWNGPVSVAASAEIMRVLGTGEEVQLAITENQFVLQMPNFVMTARLIEGQFPNYEAVIPKGHPGKLVIARGALTAALRRVSVMAEERNKPVKLILAPAALRLSAASQDLGEAEETLDVDYAGEEVTIGFNSRYVLDAISPVENEQVVLEFKDSLSPGVVRSATEEGYCCVIMPMRDLAMILLEKWES